MADENKPAFYPRVGRNIAKNFRSAQPAPFIEDPRAMDIPHEYYDIPTAENRELSRRRGERIADLERQKSADTSPLEKLAGGLQAGRFLGSALTQAINSAPTRLFKGDEAADKFMQERLYKPEQPLAYEYAGDVGNFLEKLETEYKIPPLMPEAVALQYLTGPATSQAMKAAGRGAEKAGMALERGMEPVVKGALERGGLPREMALGMGANTQSNVMKPSGKGANWLDGKRGSVEAQLGKMKMADYTTPEQMAEMQKSIDTAKRIMGDDPEVQRAVGQMENELSTAKRNNAINSWIDSNLRNYVKNQMATPDDPVRKLAEEGILHMAPYGEQGVVSSRLMNKRMGLGQDPLGMGRSDPARFWERMSDISVDAYPAGSYKHGSLDESLLADNPWLQKIPDETMIYSGKGLGGDLGFDHIIDVLRQDVREGRIRPEQLNKVSMEQAVRRVHEYDQEMAKRMAEAQVKATEGMPVHKEYPEGYRWLELTTPQVATELPSTHVVEPYQSKGVLGQLYRVINPTTGMRGEGYVTPERAIKEFNKSQAEEKLADALKYEGETMGHCVGGYCPDVVAGKSRIYSLRDTKGEPHVTVEVQPNQHLDYNSWFSKQPEEIQNKIAQRRLEDKNHDIYEGPEYLAAREALPPKIKQIKGKQNAKPKDDYLPFVQDFVREGNWSDVGDFKNTGFDWQATGPKGIFDPKDIQTLEQAGHKVPKYLTNAEKEDLTRKWYELDSGNDYDTGLPKVPPPKGMKRGGKVSISNNPDTMMLEVNNRKMAVGGLTKLIKGAKAAAKVEPEIMKASEALGKIEGRPLVITQADRTKVGEGYLGGPGFSSLQLTEPEYRAAEAAWGVKNAGTAKMILGGAKKAGDNPVFTTMIGSPTQHQSNQMVFDKLYGDFKKAAKKGGLPPELRDKINDRLASAVDKEGNAVFPSDIDILDKNFKDIADTFDRRSIAGHLMGGVQVGGKKGQIIDYDKIIRETTDPALIDVPSGSLGNRMFTLSGGIIDRPDLHPAFPTILQGEDLGVSFNPVARDLLMKDFIEKTMREKGRKPGYMDFTRGHPPSQIITEDILTEMQKLGLKKGGAVHKAAGGEITGDDLIIEERPL